MALKPWKKLKSEVRFKNPYWEYVYDNCELPNGLLHEYHSVHTGGSVMIVPMLENGNLLLVNQYRYLNNRLSIEFPAGGMKPGEIPDKIARKELIEETGFDGDIEKIGIFNPYNGVTDEICHVYFARNLKHSKAHLKDKTEEFELIEADKEKVSSMVSSNEIYDGMTLAAWSLAGKYLYDDNL